MNRQQRTVGAIVEIPLENGYHTYARILENDLAFYDIRTKSNDMPIQNIIRNPILFFATVYDQAITKGYWKKIGDGKVLPLEDKVLDKPPFYTQDPITKKYSIYEGDSVKPAIREDCIGLEYFSVWSREEMEKRLNDHFADRENSYVKLMHSALMFGGASEEELETMNIHAEYGDKVKVTKITVLNGYKGDSDSVKKHLTIDKVYTVDWVDIGNWKSTVYLIEVPDVGFNSTNFVDVKE